MSDFNRQRPRRKNDSKAELIKKREARLMRNKINLVTFFIIILITGLLLRIAYIKIVHGKEYERVSVIQPTNQNVEQTITASRGDIIDRNGKLLATSTSLFLVYIDVTVIADVDANEEKEENKDKAKNNVATALEEVLGIDKEETLSYFKGSTEDNNYTVMKRDIPYSKAKEIRDYRTPEGKRLIGVHLEETNKRMYPFKNLASQTIGFISGDGGNDNWGIENYYDKELTGVPGRYFTSYDGSRNVVTNEIEPTKGNTVALTLDYELQQYTDGLVAEYGIKHDAKNASIIVMKPNSGEILAMSEYATFNNNAPGNLSYVNDPTFKERHDSLEDNDPERGEMIYKLWKNFNISNTFEPGSIYKPLVVAAAMEENLITENDVYDCSGYLEYNVDDGIRRIRCWIYNDTGGGHGRQNVEEVLANSCNVGMMKIGEKMGRSIFYKYQTDFGVGSKTGIDLPGEEGISKELYHSEANLNIIELVTGSFGQGFNTTALQSLVAFNSVINGGNFYKPYLVSQIIDSNGKIVKQTEPEILKKVISKDTSDYIRESLISVVEYGTGRNLAIEGYSIGGKTATGEQGVRETGDYTVSFIGYLPVDNPQYIAIGVIDKPSDYVTNRTSAVPMMKELFEKMISYYRIPSDTEISSVNSRSKQVFLDNYIGKNVVDVVKELNNKNYDFILVGSGDIVKSQMPIEASLVTDSTNVFLYLEESEEPTNLVEVPDLIGLSDTLSIEALKSLNLKFIVINDSDELTNTDNLEIDNSTNLKVVKQMPTTGVKVPVGTEVRIILDN